MTLKETCQKHGWNYHQAWYALATRKVCGPKLMGRVWQISQRDVKALECYFAKRKEKKHDDNSR